MKRKIGNVLIGAGTVLMAAALCLLLYNQHQERRAEEHTAQVIPQVVEVIQQRQQVQQEQHETRPILPDLPFLETAPREMTAEQIDGYGYIGFLQIPALELELPVMADWSYGQLQIAPCRYSGSLFSDDLVIMAHNYTNHFGQLKNLRTDDPVLFTDMDGITTEFRVIAMEILSAAAVEEMTAGEYDLTLFTCTYGGENRVAIRCDRVEN